MDQEIIDALSAGEWKKAVKFWSQTQNESGECAEFCAWGGAKTLLKCAHCLEGRLRTMSLYSHIDEGEDILLKLSRELNDWSKQQTS